MGGCGLKGACVCVCVCVQAGVRRRAGGLASSGGVGADRRAGANQLLRTKWIRRVPHPVLIGHAASLTPY